jgi:hypothetical protein
VEVIIDVNVFVSATLSGAEAFVSGDLDLRAATGLPVEVLTRGAALTCLTG